MAPARRLVGLLTTSVLAATGLMAVPALIAPAAAVTAGVGFTADPAPTWQTNGIVWSLEETDGLVFAGGTFSAVRPPGSAAGVNQTPASNIVVLDAGTGSPSSRCTLNVTGSSASVRAMDLSPDESTLYIGGLFAQVNGVFRQNLAAVDVDTCTVLPGFNPRPSSWVQTLATSPTDGSVYFAGEFLNVGGVARTRAAAVGASGALLGFAPTIDNIVFGMDVTPDGASVVVGGQFNNVNSVYSHALVVLSSATGATTRGYPTGTFPATSNVKDVFINSTGVYTAHEGHGGGVFDGRAAFDLGTFNQRWRDTCLGATQAVLADGDNLYAAHHAHDCSSIGLFPDGRRQHLTVQSAANRNHSVWWPDTNDGIGELIGPRDLAIGEAGGRRYLYVAGEFTRVNDVPQQGIMRLPDGPDVGGPSNPGYLTASTSIAGRVLVRWTAATDRDDEMIRYDVYRGSSATPIGSVTVGSDWWRRPGVSFADTTVTPGQNYTYRVRSVDPAGNMSGYSPALVVTAATTSSPYASAVLQDDPTLLWRHDTPSGNVLGDETANGNGGTLVGGVTLGAVGALLGESNPAITYNGSNGYGYKNTATAAPTAYSVETWFRTNTTRGGKIVGFGNGTTGLSGNYDRHVYMLNNGRLAFGAWTGTANVVQTSTGYNDNQWHHVVATQGPNGMALYVDGRRVGKNNVTDAQPYTGGWRVGGDNLSGWPNQPASNFFAGTIDETSVYPGVLTAQRVASHYIASGRTLALPPAPADQYGTAVTADSPTVYWRLDETSGSTAQDSTPSDADGEYFSGVSRGTAPAVESGTAVTLDGSGNARVAEITGGAAPRVWSAEVWLRTTSITGGKVFGFGSSRTGTSTTADKHLYMTNDGKLVLGVQPSGRVTITSPGTYNDGQWHHVVATQGPSGLVLYVDGAAVGSNATTTSQTVNGFWRLGTDNLIAWPSQPLSSSFAGSLDEFAVYPTALTAGQVVSHYGTVVEPPDTTAPTAPGALTAEGPAPSPSGGPVELDWSASTDEVGVTSYTVHRSSTPGFTPAPATAIASVGSPGYVDPAVPNGTWYYVVTASDAAGNTSAASDHAEVTLVAPDTTAPTTPTELTGSTDGATVSLGWTASTDDRGVAHYTVHRSATSGFVPDETTEIGEVLGTSYVDSGVASGTWHYRITATDAAGNVSGPSDQTSQTVSGDPVTVQVTASEDAYVNQSAPASNVGSSTSLSSNNTAVVSYLRFPVPAAPVGQTLQSATLRVRTTTVATAASVNAHQVLLGPGGWNESTLTWSNRPGAPAGAQVGTVSAPAVNTTYTVTLDAAQVAAFAGGDLNLLVQGGSGDNIWFWSSEAVASYRPELTLNYAP